MTTILYVNDIHSGSNVSVMPDCVTLEDGNKVYSNQLQKIQFAEWKRMCDSHDIDVCIVNGDMCDGVNYNGRGAGLWTVDENVQVTVAKQLLEMTGAKIFHGFNGSEYHTGKSNNNLDERTMKMLGGTFSEDGLVTYDGVTFHVRHDPGGFTTVPYTRSTGINKDMVNTFLEPDEFGDVDVFLRAHTHFWHYVGWKGILGLINPGWKYKDAFIKQRHNIGCDMGYTIFEVEDGEYQWNTFTFKVPREIGMIGRKFGEPRIVRGKYYGVVPKV